MMKPGPNTVHLTLTLKITVDAEAWELAYGVRGKRAIAADVKNYILNGVQSSVAGEECALTAEIAR